MQMQLLKTLRDILSQAAVPGCTWGTLRTWYNEEIDMLKVHIARKKLQQGIGITLILQDKSRGLRLLRTSFQWETLLCGLGFKIIFLTRIGKSLSLT